LIAQTAIDGQEIFSASNYSFSNRRTDSENFPSAVALRELSVKFAGQDLLHLARFYPRFALSIVWEVARAKKRPNLKLGRFLVTI
jgi:hypothetical protein